MQHLYFNTLKYFSPSKLTFRNQFCAIFFNLHHPRQCSGLNSMLSFFLSKLTGIRCWWNWCVIPKSDASGRTICWRGNFGVLMSHIYYNSSKMIFIFLVSNFIFFKDIVQLSTELFELLTMKWICSFLINEKYTYHVLTMLG